MVASNYANNGRLRIDFVDVKTGEPCFTLTVNLTDEDPGDDAFFIKDYSENQAVVPQLLATGVFVRAKGPRDAVWKFMP
jgi:hypothetical protein